MRTKNFALHGASVGCRQLPPLRVQKPKRLSYDTTILGIGALTASRYRLQGHYELATRLYRSYTLTLFFATAYSEFTSAFYTTIC